MQHMKRFATSTVKILSALIACSLLASCKQFAIKPNVPTVPCEQGPPRLIPLYPDGSDCRGSAEARRECYSQQVAHWAVDMQGLYAGEVEKRATEDRCLERLRKAGLIN